MAKKWLLLLLEVTEEELPEGNVYTELPDKLCDKLAAVLPETALEFYSMYLLSRKQKLEVERLADKTAVNYHHYAVSVRGEKCDEKDCEQHPLQNILDLNDHKQRRKNAPGLN